MQEPKGLYGVFIAEPKARQQRPDVEVLQVLGESGGYYLINRKAFPAIEPIKARVDQKVLIRLVNMGQMPHPMHMHGHPFIVTGSSRARNSPRT